MQNTYTSLAFLALVTMAASGCTAAQDDEPETAKEKDSAEDPLIGGTYPSPSFAKDTGTLLIRGGCTAARVGPRHILTAAHCVSTYLPGLYLSITQSPNDSNADWSTIGISRVWVHPSFKPVDLLCGPSLKCSRDLGVSDVAVIQTTNDMPTTISTARVGTYRYEAAGYQRRVFLTGYGCEDSVFAPPPVWGQPMKERRLGISVAPIEPVSSINKYGPVLNNAQFGPFDGSYFLTPRLSHPNGNASLCPGDSGGPVFLDRPVYPGGPARATNVVIGVNADYTFDGSYDRWGTPSGISTFNIHTRLSNDAPNYVSSWLQSVLPASSFLRTMDP